MSKKLTISVCVGCLFLLFAYSAVYGEIVSVGSGSYTTIFPGVDRAGRNSFPSGKPLVSGDAAGKPIPTNDWWSAKIKRPHVSNLFNYPLALKTVKNGLVVSYIPWGVYDDHLPITVGVVALDSSKATISDYSDWTVTMDWADGAHSFNVTAGIGLPFLYFTKQKSDIAEITINCGKAIVDREMILIENCKNGASFAVYAPSGSRWKASGDKFISSLNGKNYWSMAMLPLSATDLKRTANELKQYAYVFPQDTKTTYIFDEKRSIVRTDFRVDIVVKEGGATKMLLGLLPHQWANLSAGSSALTSHTNPSVRGEIKMIATNSFSVENSFHGVLPTLPYVHRRSVGFSLDLVNEKIRLLEDTVLSPWTDSYNEGQAMNRLIQTARIADLTGNGIARDKIINTIQQRLEDWLQAATTEVAFLFYYDTEWTSLIGYPAGHGQDYNLNDHHFHWGYFVHAAAFLAQYIPGWASEWGGMVDLLIRDAASSSRTDPLFPYLRNFSPYGGHSWANGFATFPQGNDQESSSESIQFSSALIHWGVVTKNKAIRDLGVYLYTTEQSALEEYWFDIEGRIFKNSQPYSIISRLWGNSYDNKTFWTEDIAASYGIELYPIHGGSLYLGHHPEFIQRLWNEISANTNVNDNVENDNLWYDVLWKYLAFIDPQKALNRYNSYPSRKIKFGVSDAQTYYWLHGLSALGRVEAHLTADYPVAAAFRKNGVTTYVAHNYNDDPLVVRFSDGYTLDVPAGKMVTGTW